jgi:hypothetical protein
MSSTTVHPGRRTGLRRSVDALRAPATPDVVAWAALALVMLAGAAALLYLTRGTFFWFDEWLWITGRRGNSLATFLDPHNSHLSLVPIVIYKLLFAAVGISHYVPYRVVVIASHLLVVLLVYLYVKRRVGPFVALLAAVSILLLGPGWQEFLWPFQIAWLIAIASGIGALLMLDRRDRLAEVVACCLIAVSVASSSVGVAIAIAMIVEIRAGRRTLRDAWIVGIPLALYVLWTIGYQHAVVDGDLSSTIGFAAQSSVIALPALLGLSGTNALNSNGTLLAFGAPLTVAAVGVMAWAALRHRIFSARALTLALTLIAFWGLTGIARSDLSGPFATRYVYVDVVFFVLLVSELARGVVIRSPLRLTLGVITVLAVISNVGVLRSGASYLRQSAAAAEEEIGALNVSRQFAAAGYVARAFPGYPFVRLKAVDLYSAERSLGTVGNSPIQLAAAPEGDREIADAEMRDIRGLRLVPGAAVPPVARDPSSAGGSTPTLDSTSAGATSRLGACVSFAATAAAAGQPNALALTVPTGGIRLYAIAAQASIAIRRLASAFIPLGTIPAGTGATLQIPADRVAMPWHLRVTSAAHLIACALAR